MKKLWFVVLALFILVVVQSCGYKVVKTSKGLEKPAKKVEEAPKIVTSDQKIASATIMKKKAIPDSNDDVDTDTVFVKSIFDKAFGGGIMVEVVDDKVIVSYGYSKNDASTDGGRIKYSAPWNNRASDSGTILTKGGETFVGYMSQLGVKNGAKVRSASFTVPAGGKGIVELVFENPSKGENMFVVVGAKKAGTNNQFLINPARGLSRVLYYRDNPKHPDNAEATVVFELNDKGIRTVIAGMKEAGWLPAKEFWERRGMSFGGPATLKQIYE